MAWLRRISALLLVFLVSGCCTTLFNSANNGFLGGSLGIAPDDNDSEPVIGAVYGCDCDNVPGLSTSVAGDVFFPSQGNAFAAHVLARYLFASNGTLGFWGTGGGVLKRFSYGSDYQIPGGGGAAAFTSHDTSETNFGITLGVGVDYEGFERATPFASIERFQVGDGGFQVMRVGSRWTLN